jgi:hypothetical protein
VRQTSYAPAGRFQALSKKLKWLGHANEKRIKKRTKLYGQEFRLVNDPVVMTDSLVFVDAVETRTGRPMRRRIPMNIVNMAQAKVAA